MNIIDMVVSSIASWIFIFPAFICFYSLVKSYSNRSYYWKTKRVILFVIIVTISIFLYGLYNFNNFYSPYCGKYFLIQAITVFILTSINFFIYKSLKSIKE